MAEPAQWQVRGTEISERSEDLVLPDDVPKDSTNVVVEPTPASTVPTVSTARPSRTDPIERVPIYAKPDREDATMSEVEMPEEMGRAEEKTLETASPSTNSRTSPDRGIALPGDRGPRDARESDPRPSFWRRIAIGRRAAERRKADKAPSPERVETRTRTNEPVTEPAAASTRARLPALRRSSVSATPDPTPALEKRVVEPMLQALVSVEAKLERSHVELMGRSDQVEQRLTQLWDIEEQLGALSELQESLLTVSEQQRRLESAITNQTRTTRWLVGAILFALATGAFVVAAVLR